MAKKTSGEQNVTRISASDGGAPKRVKQPKSKSKATTRRVKQPKGETSERGGVLGYFVGAWKELRQVHWPTRRATWSLTGAVLAFSTFFVAFILLLDALFKYLFESILK